MNSSTRRTTPPHRVLVAGLLLALALCALPAAGATPDVFIHMGYSGFFRATGWVPVDVFVGDPGRDLSGKVVLSYGAQRYESPLELLRGTRTRVRFTVHLQSGPTDAPVVLSAQVYEGSRPLYDPAVELRANPINDDDALILVLDDTPEAYAFLGPAFGKPAGPAIYREQLRSASLDLLSVYPQCLFPFNAIVLGNVDVSQLTENQVECLKLYVNLGGTLIITTGAHADRYRGTWVEPYAGVTLGAVQTDAPATICRIAPSTPEARLDGAGSAATVTTPRGAGKVITFAGDADAATTHGDGAFSDTFAELAQRRDLIEEPRNALYQVINNAQFGITFEPGPYVFGSIAVYFLVLLVGGVMIARRKGVARAWVFWAVIVLGSSTYAFLYGFDENGHPWSVTPSHETSIDSGATAAIVQDTYLLVTTRRRAFEGHAKGPFALLAPSGRAVIENGPNGTFSVDVPTYKHGILCISTVEPLSGTVAGHLFTDKGGTLHGTVVNHTGLPLQRVCLAYRGDFYALDELDNRYAVGAPGSAPKTLAGYTRNLSTSPTEATLIGITTYSSDSTLVPADSVHVYPGTSIVAVHFNVDETSLEDDHGND